MEEVQRRGPTLVKEYLRYKRHVCREEYEDLEDRQPRQMVLEGTWPDSRDSVALVSTRRYLESDMDGTSWREKYLKEHVQSIQEMKQHHVHTLNSKGERVPLTHCRRADNPNKCRADFPRTQWLIDKGVVLCKGIMHRMGMSLGGEKSKLGSLHGPRTEENLNGTHPASCAFLQTNPDVQVPYRFAITDATHHSSACTDTTCTAAKLSSVIDAF